jgi:TIGR03009 family protein
MLRYGLLSMTILLVPTKAFCQQRLPETDAVRVADAVSTPRPPSQPQSVGNTHQPFQLNAIEQAYLDQVLGTWEIESSKIVTFRCPFERLEYNAFGPAPNIPHSKEKGELSYQKPDKGSFQITEIRRWVSNPIPPGQEPPKEIKGDWLPQPNLIGEHWVCDGEAVYEYRHQQEQLVVRPIPNEMRGKAIADGPLPFLFGAQAEKLKSRYWIRIAESPKPEEIWLQVFPKWAEDAANYQAVELILDRQRMLPVATRVHQPGGSRQVYVFRLAEATINGRLDRLIGLFQAPRTPFGWKRVVEK